MGMRRKKGTGTDLPRRTSMERWDETSVSVTIRGAVISPSFPRNAVLFWVLLFFPSHLSMPKMLRCLRNEWVSKCFIFPSTDGKFITGSASWSLLPPPGRHALSCKRFWLRAEAQLICLIQSCAQELKPCCPLLL